MAGFPDSRAARGPCTYGLPCGLSGLHGLRRYGFHGGIVPMSVMLSS